jgi:DNA-binding transcriptional MerR regulator
MRCDEKQARMTIGELAKRSGLSAHTIRYYERIGLLPYVGRDRSGRRDYDASILTWIEFLGRLKTTGMPIREMLHYAALRERGTATETERQKLLERHRERVRAHLAELGACLLVLDTKIAGYAGGEQRMKDYDAELPECRRKPAGTRQTRAR